MVNIFGDYFANKKFKDAKDLYLLAFLIKSDPEKTLQLLNTSRSELIIKIFKKNAVVPIDSADKFVSKVKSFFGNVVSNLSPDGLAIELCKEAIKICPDYLPPYLMIVLSLQGENDTEAFEYFQKKPDSMLNDNIVIGTAIIPMLVSVGKVIPVKNLLHKVTKEEDKKRLARNVVMSLYRSVENERKFISWIKEAVIENYISHEDSALYFDACIDTLGSVSKSSVRGNKLNDALDFLDIALDLIAIQEKLNSSNFFIDNTKTQQNFFGTDKKQLLTLKETILGELKAEAEWSSIKSDTELFKFLHKRLAIRFHPDLAKNDQDREEKAKIMPEINRAYSDKDLPRLKELALKYVPSWEKYLNKKFE